MAAPGGDDEPGPAAAAKDPEPAAREQGSTAPAEPAAPAAEPAAPADEPAATEPPVLDLDQKPRAFRAAVRLLASTSTWCKGARKLTRLRDPDAIIPLLRAYETRAEAQKLCLLDAMEALGAIPRSHELVKSRDEETRRMALHLMALFAHASHIAVLEELAARPELSERLRSQALHSLATQVQTPDWEAAMIRLLAAAPRAARAQAIESLSRRRTDTARAALRARLAVETDPALEEELRALAR